MDSDATIRHLSVRAFARLAKMDRGIVAKAVAAGSPPMPAQGLWTAPSGRVLLIVSARWVLDAEAMLRAEGEAARG